MRWIHFEFKYFVRFSIFLPSEVLFCLGDRERQLDSWFTSLIGPSSDGISFLSRNHNVCAAQHLIFSLEIVSRKTLFVFIFNFHPRIWQPKIAQAQSTDMRHMVTSNRDMPQTGIGELFADSLSYRTLHQITEQYKSGTLIGRDNFPAAFSCDITRQASRGIVFHLFWLTFISLAL